MNLLTNAGNGNGVRINLAQAPSPTSQQFRTLYVWGTFDGATVTLEFSPTNTGPWFDSGIEVTDTQAVNVECRAHDVRAVVIGGGAGTSITAELL